MGMFNLLIANVECPLNLTRGLQPIEIQIKWQAREARNLTVYHLGEELELLLPDYRNKWIITSYICPVCTPIQRGQYGPYYRTVDQVWHTVNVLVKDNKFADIRSSFTVEESRTMDPTSFYIDP